MCVYFLLYTAPVFMALLSWVGAQVLPFSCKNKDLEKTMLLTDSLTKTGIQGNIQTSKGAKACWSVTFFPEYVVNYWTSVQVLLDQAGSGTIWMISLAPGNHKIWGKTRHHRWLSCEQTGEWILAHLPLFNQ